jgi:hypothetical protein
MGTPGNNVVNGKVDDVSSPERQKQMVQLVAKLKQFNPTSCHNILRGQEAGIVGRKIGSQRLKQRR